jgi:surfeit locus 1 family protein
VNAVADEWTSERRSTSILRLATLTLIAIAGVAGFIALGMWQLHRLAWKEALISRVDARIHAEPVAAPPAAQWRSIDAAKSEYLNVRVHGQYLQGRETLVQAVTVRGAGFWVITPLQTDAGYTVLINRGFVGPQYKTAHVSAAERPTTVTGLLRISETGRSFLRSNDPGNGRWYSRNVVAISGSRGLSNFAPYFIDAAASEAPTPGTPEGGLTVVRFRNQHLQYALTWFALALMVAYGAVLVCRHERRLSKPAIS